MCPPAEEEAVEVGAAVVEGVGVAEAEAEAEAVAAAEVAPSR